MARCEEDADALIVYCTSFQSQGSDWAAGRAKESLIQCADSWSNVSPPRVMDLKDLARKSAAAGLKDIAAHAIASIRRATAKVPDPRLASNPSIAHGCQNVNESDDQHLDCVLRRLWLCFVGRLRRKRAASRFGRSLDRSLQRAKPAPTTSEIALSDVMQQLVNRTFRCWGSGEGSLPTSVPNGLEVMSVVHVENIAAFGQFIARRAQIVDDLGMHSAAQQALRTPVVTEEINEYWLWHGTTPEGAAGILSRGFDLSKAGTASGSMFGNGICFAESSMKADFYAKSADERGWRVLLLCRVVLGGVLYCDSSAPDGDHLAANCSSGRAFHSVMGDREKVAGSFREFVVFDERQVYPEYLVWYKRN